MNPQAKDPLHLDDTGRPAANGLTLAHALKSAGLGGRGHLAWDDTSSQSIKAGPAPFCSPRA